MNYIENEPEKFKLFIILSKDVEQDISNRLTCYCNDEKLSKHGLPCRSDCAIRHFYYNMTEPWLYMADDDDWINFDAFEKFLTSLEQNYDPLTMNLFAANLQQMYNVSFPHGGPGWLASRHFIKIFLEKNLSVENIANREEYITDDISLGIILKENFPDLRFWANPWSLVALPQVNWINTFRKKKWKKLKECSHDLQQISIRDLFVIHVTPFNQIWVEALENVRDAPHYVKMETKNFIFSEFCKCSSKWCDLQMNKNTVRKRIKPDIIRPWYSKYY